MRLAAASVRRPVLATMITLIIVVLGLVSLARLRIDLLPDVELPTLTVSTRYEGASSEVVETRVTRIVEEIVSTVPGIEEMSSSSSEGSSRVRLRFSWGSDLDVAATEVRAKLEDELSELPDDVERPQLRKFDVSSFPIVILGVSSNMDPIEMTTLLEDRVLARLAQIRGVAQVDPWGEYQRELRVELLPDRLRALGLPLDTILSALRDANIDLPAGEIDSPTETLTLRAPARFSTLREVGQTIVARRAGAPIYLEQIANVHDTHRRRDRIARINGAPGLRLAIRKQADANTVEVAQRVLAEAAAIHRDYPQLRVTPVVNQGNFIERSIANVARSVVYGGALAILILLAFLRDVRSTFVIALAIPISLAATFAIIYFAGLTLNLMTLGGLALGIGMMVDSSIVVLENIYRRRDSLGESVSEAAVRGTGEVGMAIVASTITTLVIFLPLAYTGGVPGVLFGELAQVIAFSLAASLVVALSIIPMLASKLLVGAKRGSSTKAGALSRGYHGLLGRALAYRGLVIVGGLATLVASAAIWPAIGREFMPPSDEGEVRVTGEMAIGTRLELLDEQVRALEAAVYPKVPETMSSVVSVGPSYRSPSASATGEIRMTLVPAAERQRSNTEIADSLRSDLAQAVAGMSVRTRAPQGQFLLQRVLGSEEGLTIEVLGHDLDQLDHWAARAAEVALGVSGITDTEISRKAGLPQLEFSIDREKAASLGLSVRDVARSLEVAAAGAQAGQYHIQGQAYRILVRIAEADTLSADQLLDMLLQTPDGSSVALGNLVEIVRGTGPVVIERRDQQRVVTIDANVAGRDMGSVAVDLQAALAELKLPAGTRLRLAGQYEQQQKAFEELAFALLLALALVYMVLAGQYESLIDPLVVMASVPVAAIGVLVALVATDTTFNVQSYIGCIMLGGIVVNNAILLVDQTRRLRAEGLELEAAVREAASRRLRPILMTTSTTVLALAPLALGIGEGADAQAPLARAVLGGLVASTVITLVLIPAVYVTVHRGRGESA